MSLFWSMSYGRGSFFSMRTATMVDHSSGKLPLCIHASSSRWYRRLVPSDAKERKLIWKPSRPQALSAKALLTLSNSSNVKMRSRLHGSPSASVISGHAGQNSSTRARTTSGRAALARFWAAP